MTDEEPEVDGVVVCVDDGEVVLVLDAVDVTLDVGDRVKLEVCVDVTVVVTVVV